MRSNKGITGKLSFWVVFILSFVVVSQTALGQFDQLDRFKQRRERAVKAAEDREKANNGGAAQPAKTKLPVMNVDVQMVLTRQEYPNFAAAKPNPAVKVIDGESLWMYVRFNGKISNFVGEPENGEDGKPRYKLYAEIGPKGDITALNRYTIVLREEDLSLSELKINLAPGLKGRNASIPILLDRAGASSPGVWQNEIRLSNTTAEPRPITMNLASVPLTFDLIKGNNAYKRYQSAYDSVIVLGSASSGLKPPAGSFESERVRNEVTMDLKTRSMVVLDMRFVGDDWMDSFALTPTRTRSRSVLAFLTFSNEDKCFEGIARVRESFNEITGAFESISTELKDTKAVACPSAN